MSKTYKKWTKEEVEFIVNNSKTMKDKQIASYLDKIDGSRTVTIGMVRRQRRKMRVSKPRGRPVGSVVSLSPEDTTS
jgi:hypothetical protein